MVSPAMASMIIASFITRVDSLNNIKAFVTGFTKTVLIGTRNEIHFIADYEIYTLALPKNTKHIAIDSQVCFH